MSRVSKHDSRTFLHASRRRSPAPEAAGARVILAGAALDNDNRGVEALGRSVVDRLLGSGSVSRLSVLDDGWGVRVLGEGLEAIGVRNSRRWHRRESWSRIRLDLALGGLGSPIARRFRDGDAVLDISGGDSFTDLYGPRRLATVCAPKEAALRTGRPLVLLPQTFGPFRTESGRRRAERIIGSASLIYSRDAWSHEQLVDLAGPGARPGVLREGVDVAFALEPREPGPAITDRVNTLPEDLLVGVNVSGLLRTSADQARFGLAGDYLATMTAVVRSLITAGAVVMLIPHVHGEHVTAGQVDGENDETAVAAVQQALSPGERERTWMVPPTLRAAELKWCIARTEWFIGTRMHATIAALSSQVPTFAYAYSDKFRGVFGTCGVGDHLADARQSSGPAAVQDAMASFEAREQARQTLGRSVPAVVARSREQLDEIVSAVTEWSGIQENTRSR